MKTCAVCTKKSRKLTRAIVLDGPGSMRRGLVCGSCAATGWLLVFGGEEQSKKHHAAVRGVAAKALAALDPEERKLAMSLAVGGLK